MFTIENEIQCVEVIHKKGDDFFRVLEFLAEDDTSFDPTPLNLLWAISNDTEVIIVISGADLTEVENQIEFRKDASYLPHCHLLVHTHTVCTMELLTQPFSKENLY